MNKLPNLWQEQQGLLLTLVWIEKDMNLHEGLLLKQQRKTTVKNKNKFNGSQVAKIKSTFPTFPCYKIYGVEAVGLTSSNYTSI